MLELLSPAGSMEAVIASVTNGADAIYLGLKGLGALDAEKDFTEEEFAEAVKYCRVRGCKIYVTFDTLLRDTELLPATRLASQAARGGADALIVRDAGFLKILRQVLPDMPLYCSAGMGIHNLAGVEAAYEMGADRVFLARELGFERMQYIAARSPVELAVTVQGSLCVCHANQCYMSAINDRLSYSRGVCTMPCRERYSLGGRKDDFPLNVKDNCLINYLTDLDKAGIACAKIEGRSKEPEYAALATGMYWRLLRNQKEPSEEELEELASLFSPGGFTDGYFTGQLDENIFAGESEPMSGRPKALGRIRGGYLDTEMRRVPVAFFAIVRSGETAKFAVRDMEGNISRIEGDTPAAAVLTATTESAVEEVFYKTAGTPFLCKKVECLVDKGVFIDPAEIAFYRDELLARLAVERAKIRPFAVRTLPAAPSDRKLSSPPVLNFEIHRPEQFSPELAELAPRNVYVPLEMLLENITQISAFTDAGVNVVGIMPRVISGEQSAEVRVMLQRVKALGVSELLINHLGHMRLARLGGFSVRGDYGLGVYNSYTLKLLEEAGLLSATASFELKITQIGELIKSLDTEIIAYGRLPAMVTEHCLLRRSYGRCICHNLNQMKANEGLEYPVMKEFGCRNVIYSSRKLFIADRSEDYENIGLWGIRLVFTTESLRECVNVAKRYMHENKHTPNGLTRGMYYSGVK